jgi:hypothetical protein
MYGFFSASISIADVYRLVDTTISAPRRVGDYGLAMRNGLIACHWWINQRHKTLEASLLGGALLIATGHATGHAENILLIKRLLILARRLLAANPQCVFTQRMVRNAEAQFLYNTNPDSRRLLKRALDLHEADLELSNKIVTESKNPTPAADSLLAVGESYCNRLDVLIKLGVSQSNFDKEMDQMRARWDQLSRILFPNSSGEVVSGLRHERDYLPDLLRVRQSIGQRQYSFAADLAERLCERVQSKNPELIYVVAYSHYYAGFAKVKADGRLPSTSVFNRIEEHSRIAQATFKIMGNARMQNSVARDLFEAPQPRVCVGSSLRTR